jgi:hypothetical protein
LTPLSRVFPPQTCGIALLPASPKSVNPSPIHAAASSKSPFAPSTTVRYVQSASASPPQSLIVAPPAYGRTPLHRPFPSSAHRPAPYPIRPPLYHEFPCFLVAFWLFWIAEFCSIQRTRSRPPEPTDGENIVLTINTAASVMMPSSPGHVASLPYTNGHLSPLAAHMTTADSPSQHSDSDLSDANPPAAADQASDADAPGEEYDEDEEMVAASDSSEDVDAEGEPDGDYDSDSPPSEQAESDHARSSSPESKRPLKRKASDEAEDYIEQNPSLYGLRRSVCGFHSLHVHELTVAQGRARPSRRVVSDSQSVNKVQIDMIQVDSSDEDDDSGSDKPRKRQRTASRKSLSTHLLPVWCRTNYYA